MPAYVGAIKVTSISSSSVFNIGDAYSIQPMSTAKTYAGGGSFNTGEGINVHLGHSSTFVYDKDFIDQGITTQE